MNTLLRTIFLFTCILTSLSVIGQTNDVSYWYERSIDSIDAFYRLADSTKHRISKQYLKKAQNNKNLNKISEAYVYKLLAHSHTRKAPLYGDSVVHYATKTNNQNLLGLGYLHKGIQLYYLSDFSEALENYLKAESIISFEKKPYYKIKIKHYIGLLKLYTNKVHAAKNIFKQNVLFFEKRPSYKTSHTSQYFKSLYALSKAYEELGNYFKSKKTSEIALKNPKIQSSYMHTYFLFHLAAIEKSKGNFKKAIMHYNFCLTKLLPTTNKKEISSTMFKMYTTYVKMNNTKNALDMLIKIDSFYQKHPQGIYEAHKANFELYKYYKKKRNTRKQLKTLTNFFTIDSILKEDRKDIHKRILTNYEIQPLLEEKRKLITQLANESKRNKSFIYLLLSIGLILIFLIFLKIRKTKLYKKRFDVLMQSNTTSKIKEALPTKQNATNSTSTLSEETKNQILKKLATFERKQLFLQKQYTLVSLAKELETNSAYLSKIINEEKQCNFANYLNQLKINYAIERLKMDTTFRKYTVKAIAEASGFNNSQSFSSSFYKQTGIYPSYFIKQLNNLKTSS